MKVLYLGVVRSEPLTLKGEALELCHEVDLGAYSRWTKGTVNEFLTFVTVKVAKAVKKNDAICVEEKGHFIHLWGHPRESVVGVMIVDSAEYPDRVAKSLLRKIADEFVVKYPRRVFLEETEPNTLPLPQLKDYLVKYQDPHEGDPIMRIQNELDGTMEVMHKNIESMLERGEKIDSLVAKSDNLSAASKMFYTQAKKQNSCCVVM